MENPRSPTSRDQPSQRPERVHPYSLEEALVNLRLWNAADHENINRSDHHQLKPGDTWSLGHEGLRVVLLEKPSSHTPARLAATATTSATALPASLLQPTQSPTPIPTPRCAPQQPPLAPPSAAAREEVTSSVGAIDHAKQRALAVALSDFCARRFHAAIMGSPTASSHGIRSDYNTDTVGQFVLETNHAAVSPTTGTVSLVFEVFPNANGGQRLWEQQKQQGQQQRQIGGQEAPEVEMGVGMAESLRGVVKQALLNCAYPGGGLDVAAARLHVESVQDQRHLRHLVAASDGIAFIANGSVLPRRSGSDDRPMEVSMGAVPFRSPESLQAVFRLPHRGDIEGMLVPRGVTVIVGGGYHGKSTLLRALAVGVYDKVPGDGRELAVTDPGAVTVRAEDGRPVSGVDISPFISSLPSPATAARVVTTNGTVRSAGDASGGASSTAKQEAETTGSGGNNCSGSTNEQGMTTERFSTGGASGSTSQAANVVEALEVGATALLLDEDTCAGNFMIRDSRMRAMVHHEPITPFIYRVSSLWLELGVSSVIVVGGCGDYFDVHNTAILVDNYAVSDATERAHSISRRFCVGRVQYAGRGLVHRLPWPGNASPRAVIPRSILGPSARKTLAPKNKRKREISRKGSFSGVDAVPKARNDSSKHAEVDYRDSGRHPISSKGRGRTAGNEEQRSPGTESDGDELCCTDSQVSTGGEERLVSNRCQCPCFCGHGHRAEIFSSSLGAVGNSGAASGRVVRVGSSSADLSRVEQLVGGEAMIRGCALGVGFVIRATELSPIFLPVSKALDLLDAAITKPDEVGDGAGRPGVDDGGGLKALLAGAFGEAVATCRDGEQRQAAEVSTMPPVGGGPLVALPRRFEVAAALNRIRGVLFQSAAEVAIEGAKASD